MSSIVNGINFFYHSHTHMALNSIFFIIIFIWSVGTRVLTDITAAAGIYFSNLHNEFINNNFRRVCIQSVVLLKHPEYEKRLRLNVNNAYYALLVYTIYIALWSNKTVQVSVIQLN